MMQIYNKLFKFGLLNLALTLNTFLFGQGIVIDAESKQVISQAHILWVNIGTISVSNEKGEFNIPANIPAPYIIKVSAMGYETQVLQLSTLSEISVSLTPSHIDLHEISISASTGVLQKNNLTNLERKGIDELQHVQAISLGQALSQIPGVYSSSLGNGIAKPVIRGLSGTRVVTYWQGLRIENQQWGGDHGLAMGEAGIQGIEVIKGPSSLLYGADALGGVLFFTETPYTVPGKTEAYAESIWESNSRGTKNTAGILTSLKNIRIQMHGGFNNHADFQLSDGLFVKNSRWKDQYLKTSIGFNFKKYVGNIRYQFMNQRIGLPGHTHDTTSLVSDFLSPEQNRKNTIPAQHIFNHYFLWENHLHFTRDELKWNIGWTQNQLLEYDEKITIPSIDMTLKNMSIQGHWKRNILPKTHTIIGSQSMLQNNLNNPLSSVFLIPDAQTLDMGIFSLIQGDHLWQWQVGIRLDQRKVKALPTGPFLEFFQNNYQGINYSASLAKKIKTWTIRANTSSGYRPPHSSELLSQGAHHGSFRYEIGNKALQSEYAKQVDISLEYGAGHLSLIINPYYQFFQNYIFLNPADSIVGRYQVFKYEQANKARLHGGEFALHYHPHFWHEIHLEQNISYTHAVNDQGQFFPLIPPLRIQTSARLSFANKKKLEIEDISLQHLYMFSQKNTATYESPSKAYGLWNIGLCLQWKSKNPVKIQAGIRNLSNEHYIDHLSGLKNLGIASPGRSYYLGIKINIQSLNR